MSAFASRSRAPSEAPSGAGPEAGSGGSMLNLGSRFSSHPGSHQLAPPSMCISAGTRRVRSTNASSATAAASPVPNIATTRSPLSTKAPNTAIMMTAAELITRPVSARPMRTARALSPVRRHSSYILLTRKTW